MPLMLLKHWRLVAALGAITAAFLAGWYVNGWRKDAALQSALEAANTELVEAIQKGRRDREEAVEAERIRALTLNRQLAAERERNAALREDIANARLSVPESRTPAEVDEMGTYSCPAPLGSDDFIRLWNEAARAGGGRTGSDPG